jgi:hypothetical protein
MADAYEVFSIAVERVQHLSGEILGYLILGTYPIFGYFPLLRAHRSGRSTCLSFVEKVLGLARW